MEKITIGLKSIIKRLAFAYIVICISMFVMQRHLMYLPITTINSPASYGLTDFSNETLVTKDFTLIDSYDTKIQTWYHAAKENHPTIVFFHGNGGNLANRAEFFSLLRDASFGVLALDYRGYGASEDSPSEEGFYQDARETMNYATKTLSLPNNKIIIYGESIGSGVAVQMATEYKIAALVLQSPFTSMTNTVKYHYPWLPVDLLLKDRYESINKIANIHVPLLLFHGEIDDIVPATQGKGLFAHANEPKQAIYFPNKGHNDLELQKLTNAVVEFSKKYQLFY